jgi:hypothetical protein
VDQAEANFDEGFSCGLFAHNSMNRLVYNNFRCRIFTKEIFGGRCGGFASEARVGRRPAWPPSPIAPVFGLR